MPATFGLSTAPAPDKTGWAGPALIAVFVVTMARLVALVFNRTDLFVDESQYWLWGQYLDFGYYSKPPLIGWLIRAVTDLAGSDAAFWVRMPGAVLHGITAMILGALGARLGGRAAGVWSAVTYVTLPFVAVGSLLISTDTVMAPFYAAGVFFLFRLQDSRAAGDALLAGACIGAAFMAKYAAIYLLIGAPLAMLVVPGFRPGWRNLALIFLAAAVVMAPNVWWNLTHELTTVSHTMDNAGWVRGGISGSFYQLGLFWVSQLAVFGPVTLIVLAVSLTVRDPARRVLAVLTAVPLATVSVQAWLSDALANWAVAAYFPGTVLAVLVMLPLWRRLSLAVNLIPTLLLPVLTILAPWPAYQGTPLMERYLGRAELSRALLDLAESEGLNIVADDRDILADLFHTGAGSGVSIYALPHSDRPPHYYAQMFPLAPDARGSFLWVGEDPGLCGSNLRVPLAQLSAAEGWLPEGMVALRLPPACLPRR